jgi:hypothetical protein
MGIKTEVISKDEIDEMSPEERKSLTTDIIEKMQETVILFAQALIDSGVHDEDCVGECTCGYRRARGLAEHMIMLHDHINGRTTVN